MNGRRPFRLIHPGVYIQICEHQNTINDRILHYNTFTRLHFHPNTYEDNITVSKGHLMK